MEPDSPPPPAYAKIRLYSLAASCLLSAPRRAAEGTVYSRQLLKGRDPFEASPWEYLGNLRHLPDRRCQQRDCGSLGYIAQALLF